MYSMSSTTISSSNFHLITKALADYADYTGIDIKENPFANKLQTCDSANDIFDLLQEKANDFNEYRDGNRKLIDWLSPVVHVLHTFSGILGEAAAFVPFPPVKAIFVGVDVLLTAACGVSSSYDALVDLFECVGNFVKRLQIYTEILLSPTMIEIIVKIMVEVLSVLALATKQIKQGRFKKFAKKLLGESEIEAVLQRLGRLTDEEARMTVAQTLEVVHGLVTNVKVVMNDGKASTTDIRQALVTIQEATIEINKMKREQLQKDVRTWLSPPDPSENHIIARRDHQDGTAAWFIQSTFQEWKATGSLLWVHGKPGSGKSILCSTIIEEAEAISDAGLALMAYYYFDFRDTAKQDVRGLLTSLLGQLSAKSDLCYKILSDLYSRHNAGSRKPTDNALKQCLIDMLQLPGQPATYIIVDAVDECPNTSGVVSPRKRVLELVEELVNLRLPNLHLSFTSRPEVDILVALDPLASRIVSLQDQSGQKNDIANYVKYVVHSDRRTRRWREDKELVIDMLIRKADGMFRWVVCQLEMLLRCFPASLRVALNSLPKTLDETYQRILLGIEEENREYAHRLLQCLTVSFRPLHVEELAEVLAIRFDDGEPPDYHPDWRLEDAQEAVLSACSSLITIVNVDGSPIVQFSHFSVKEFLISDRLANARENLSRYHVLLQPSHTILAQASLSALLRLDDQVDKARMKNFPLSMYAARYWVEHGQFENVSSYIQELMERLFDPNKPYFATWVWICDIDQPLDWVEHMSSERPKEPEAVELYYATLCGFRGLVEHLITSCPEDVNAWGGTHSTPLHVSLTKGYFDIAQLLLEHGADVNTLNDEHFSPLHRASCFGRRDIVEFLLQRNTDVEVENGIDETTLDATRRNGKLDAARGSLRYNVAVDSQHPKGGTALKLASRYGHLDIMQLLLENGAAVDARNYAGWTPLGTASGFGHLDVVQLLLQNGAAVDSLSNGSSTPLEIASQNGYLEIVQLLLQNGAAVDSLFNEVRTPLQAASQNGHLEIVQLLLRNGAAVDSSSDGGMTPLEAASQNGYLEIVQLLLQNDAAVDSLSNEVRTPLQAASQNGHLEIVQLLLQNGAAVDSSSNGDMTPLGAASQNGHLEIVQLLLQNGTAVNSGDHDGWTLLGVATQHGHLDIVQLLLQNGAAVDPGNHDGWTPLGVASIFGHLDIVQLLLQHGAAVGPPSKDGMTPLQVASGLGHLDIVHLLLQNGAAVDCRDHYGWTPCHTASWNGQFDIVKLLLESGSDVNMRNSGEETPLDLAWRNGKHEVATFLAEVMGSKGVDPSAGRGVTTLDAASQNADRDVVEWSPGHAENADVLANVTTSLHTASKEGNLDAVRSLLDRGADVNERGESNKTPLRAACWKGDLEVVTLLIQHGADVNSRERAGWTPLHAASAASHHGRLDIARLLLNQGANINAKKRDLWTPLHIASCHGHLELVKLLLERGANVHVQDDDGWTPFRLASGHREIPGLLSRYGAH